MIAGIAAALDTHPLLGLGELHRQASIHHLYRRLVADPRILCRIDDIVVEFGNSRLQHIADRYVGYRRGAPVSLPEKRAIWRDTGQWMVWDSPLYERFFDAVRDANARKTCAKPVRVLLADPPIDWSRVKSAEDYRRYRIRDQFFADLLESQVLKPGRRALVIAGSPHLWQALPANTAEKPTMGQIVRARHPGAMLSLIMLPDAGIAAKLGLPPAPGLIMIGDMALGRRSFGDMVPADEPIEMMVDGKAAATPMAEVPWPAAALVVGGLLNLEIGAPVEPSADIYRDPDYQAELRRRAAILHQVHGVDFEAMLDAMLKAPSSDVGH
ncbi:hypothetical protein [Sphingomonas colocasiae]|uniref:Uncharacterized protein n=1 Tax=Sphingomonas colocasiae TaxID=1848973 RepID=A0ABS7Q0D4_9SPHN|nr:hypothetical protein [Sphingomonas colocasiae]MBY8825704.1 hypothetical protein [Sphingomonas colocasiae]